VLDLRQNADVHESVVGELLARAGVADDYASLAEADRVALLVSELGGPRLLFSPHLEYSPRTASELAILRAAADIHARFGAAAFVAAQPSEAYGGPQLRMSTYKSRAALVRLCSFAQRYRPRILGSRISRKVSPSRLNANTVREMDRPGNTTSHQRGL